MESISVINKRLAEYFGKSIDGRPNFRIVFSDTQFEKRHGTFEVSYGSIFLREETCVKEVPKYQYISGKHVLEELKFGVFPDRPFEMSSYEPLWTFQDANGNKLYPVWDAVELVVKSRLEGTRNALMNRIKTSKDYDAEAEVEKNKEIEDIGQILFGNDDGVARLKNQSVNFVKPVFLNTDKNRFRG